MDTDLTVEKPKATLGQVNMVTYLRDRMRYNPSAAKEQEYKEPVEASTKVST